MSQAADSYEYVVVGAGSAGCVLANRLSETGDAEVLVLEAGSPDDDERIADPGAYMALFGTERDWEYYTEPQSSLGGRRVYWPRGKTLGGTSSINAMIYLRGHPTDYDSWASMGNEGWEWEDVLPYFKRLERTEGGDPDYRGTEGLLNVTEPRSPHELAAAFVDAGASTGLPRTDDFNGARQEGVGLLQVTKKDGERHSVADAYLKPALDRPNLRVETNAHVRRVRFDGNRATGVTYEQGGERKRAEATGEVVLAGGAVNSPQLLLLSGVGPVDHLREHGIEVVADSPGVGRNLHDHLLLWLNYDVAANSDIYSRAAARAPSEAAACVRSDPDRPAPDVLLTIAPGYRDVPTREVPEGNGFALGVALLRPESRGRLTLRSADPNDDPRIDPNYLDEGGNLATLVAGVRRGREIVGADPLASHRGAERAAWSEEPSDADVAAYVRSNVGTFWHPVGTCRMGDDEGAVVDDALRVRGVEGLRVVDASVMPAVVGGATNAPTVMIAEKAADAIRSAR